MHASDHEQDERVRVRRPAEQPPAPRAAHPGPLGRASALGNAAVQRLLRSMGVQRKGDGGGALDESIARAIQAKRGTGRALDSDARRDLEPALGEDFSGVRVHTDDEADALNRAVQAEAFTTGSDIFFRQGRYDPGSSDGRRLLAHELTHVVQQRTSPPAQELRVSSPDDAAERQAGAVADSVGGGAAAAAVSRQAEPEEEEGAEVAASRELQRQEEEPEEEVAASPEVQRQEEPEEEEVQASPELQRQEEGEEEEEA